MERLAVEDNGAVLAAEEELAVASGGLAVNARALGGLGEHLAVLVQVLDGMALVLGALRHDDGAVLERDRDAVVGLTRLEGRDRLAAGADLGGLVDLGDAVAVGE